MKRRILLPFIVSFALLIVVVVVNRITFSDMRSYTKLVTHTRNVILAFEKLSNDLKSAEIFSPSYLNIPQRQLYLVYKQEMEQIPGDFQLLRTLLSSNDEGLALVDSIEQKVNRQLPSLASNNISELINTGQANRIYSLIVIHNLIRKGIANAEMKLTERTKEQESSADLNNLISILLALLAISIIIFAFFFNVFIYKKNLWLEGFLASVLNTSPDGITYLKPLRQGRTIVDFKVDFANKAAEKFFMFGDRPDSERLLSNTRTFRKQHVHDACMQVMKKGEPVQVEVEFDTGSSAGWCYLSVVKLEDGVTATFHDISDLKKYESQLKEKITELERSNSELEQYAFAASHDLQEPLRKIRTFGSLLKETQHLDEAANQQLNKMLSAADKMSVLIRDLLFFSGVKKGTEFVPTDLNDVLENVKSDLEAMIKQKNASITAERLPIIEAIPAQMIQLFYNILSNSLKFSTDGKQTQIAITSRLIRKEETSAYKNLSRHSDYYEITFKDDGIGFDQAFAEQIFGLFKKLHAGKTFSGSGIGLALARKVVLNHNGEINAQGKENNGATIFVYLPAQQQKS